jgi:predicted AlkP superfamily phosphohydrolase/phosphomutase
MPRLFGGRKRAKRVLVLGLDCAGPQLVFDQFKADLPVLRGLMDGGTWGELESSIPCITVPAWASMMSSRDPGVLGCYGFRNRRDRSYANMVTADGSAIKQRRVWDVMTEAGRESVVIGVPQTYPPRPLKGHLVSCFLTPGTESMFTYPAIFKQEVLKVTPDYTFDVRDFRTEDKTRLLQQIIDMTEVQHKLVIHAIKAKSWDFFMHVNIGVDRIHHGFWRYHDPQHRLYTPGNPFEQAIRDYYRMVDTLLGQVIEAAGDETTVLVASDHGVTRMDGGICINEWLWRNGWLTVKTPPQEGTLTTFENVDVDWTRSKAWAGGGYYGRVFLNVQGREPQGIIPAADYEATRDELSAAIAAIPDANGVRLNTQVFKPEAIYQQVNGVAPDLLVYFGDLHWRAIGTLGHGGIHTFENDTGPDDANHAQNGLFILCEPGQRGMGQVAGHQLMDIAPTILQRLGVKVPGDMQGRVIG